MSVDQQLGQYMDAELMSQPDTWAQAVSQQSAESVNGENSLLPPRGSRVAVVGCGTSWFMAQSYAVARERAGFGETDAFTATEFPLERSYDAVVTITRSGTTTEVLELMHNLKGKIPVTLVVGDTESPAPALADATVALPYADEQSVVQTRFATTALVYLLSSVGFDFTAAIEQARLALSEPVSDNFLQAEQFSFLGAGYTIGLANEAGLKMREAVQGWTESYPAMEYRHGPISIAAPNRVTWMFGTAPEGLDEQVAVTGAEFVETGREPLADLAFIHKIALERARSRGLDPDAPRNLTRSVILA